jgi:hypothetical protein
MVQNRKRLSLHLVFLMLATLLSISARAEDDYRSKEFHFRTGMLNTSISGGGVSKSYSVSNTLDIEYSIFANSKEATVFRGTIAHSLALARTVYAFMGVGKRYYFNSTGIASHQSGNGFEVDHVPKKRYYYGFDIGYGSGVISVLKGTSLQTQTSLLDVGAMVGYEYQLSRSNALELQLGFSYGYGFSGVAAAAQTQRLLLGFAHSF